MDMQQTIFQRIIAREIPAAIEYEDEEIIVIRDIAPSAPVHLLIIPKRVIPTINDIAEEDVQLVGKIHCIAANMARKFGIAEQGYRLVTNCNDYGGQTVFHLHTHLLGGEPLGRMNSSSVTHATTTPSRSITSTAVFDVAVFVLVAIGLAIGFNAMNPKAIAWIKPEFERQVATQNDINKYVQNTASPTTQTQQQAQQPQVQPTTDTARKTTTLAVNTATATTAQSTTAAQNATSTQPAAAAPAFTPEPGVVREISYDMFVRLLEGSKHYLIDARSAEKFAQGHINGAANYFGGEVQSRIPDLLSNVPRDRVVLIYCDGGECELSHHVADVLKQFGYGPIFIYTGGWAEWTSKRK